MVIGTHFFRTRAVALGIGLVAFAVFLPGSGHAASVGGEILTPNPKMVLHSEEIPVRKGSVLVRTFGFQPDPKIPAPVHDLSFRVYTYKSRMMAETWTNLPYLPDLSGAERGLAPFINSSVGSTKTLRVVTVFDIKNGRTSGAMYIPTYMPADFGPGRLQW